MKIYVAAKLENKEQVRATHALLREYGHEITLDWTQEPGREGLNPMEQHALMEEWGAKEMQAVENCDVFLQFPHEKSKGAYAELGMAIAWGKPVLIVEPENYIHCIFFHLKNSYFIEREVAQNALKLDMALRAITSIEVYLPIVAVAAFGLSAPMIQRISFKRMQEATKPENFVEI